MFENKNVKKINKYSVRGVKTHNVFSYRKKISLCFTNEHFYLFFLVKSFFLYTFFPTRLQIIDTGDKIISIRLRK